MSARAAGAYVLTDELYLWWLADPLRPVLVGDLALVREPRGVSLKYADSWVQQGFPLSEDLPLVGGQEFLPRLQDSAVGAVDDARPDRWGERVIRFLDRPRRLSVLEYLYFAGDDRFGALGVSTSRDEYSPRRLGPLPSLADADAIHELVRKVLANEPISPELKRLISPGVTLGGARPKALISMDGEAWIVKFADGEPTDAPLVEHATMTLAAKAEIVVAKTLPIRLTHGHAVAIKRFDRTHSQRVHALSANVALSAAGEGMGYPELAQLLRRRGVTEGAQHLAQMRELYRRMVFNILIDNTDDHEKNHALLTMDSGQLSLAPAYDVVPSGQALGYQQMRVGANGADSTIENALSMCGHFGLTPRAATFEIRTVASVVGTWRTHFANAGVTRSDLDLLAEQIDRPFLRDQRSAVLA